MYRSLWILIESLLYRQDSQSPQLTMKRYLYFSEIIAFVLTPRLTKILTSVANTLLLVQPEKLNLVL